MVQMESPWGRPACASKSKELFCITCPNIGYIGDCGIHSFHNSKGAAGRVIACDVGTFIDTGNIRYLGLGIYLYTNTHPGAAGI